MANKADLHVGDRVKFVPAGNKSLTLTGTIVKMYAAEDIVDIDCDVDLKIIQVAHVLQAHADDITLLEKAKPKVEEKKPQSERS